MEGKGCFVCCVLMILVLSAENVRAQEGDKAIAKPAMHEGSPSLLRAERGLVGSAMKGAAVGAVAGGVMHAVSKG